MYRSSKLGRSVHTEAEYPNKCTVSFINFFDSQLQIYLTLLSLKKGKNGAINTSALLAGMVLSFVKEGTKGQ